MRKLSMPSAYTIAFAFVIIAAILTWILPAGSYNYKVEGTDKIIPAAKVANYAESKKLTPIPGTYTELPPRHQGIISILQTPVLGFYNINRSRFLFTGDRRFFGNNNQNRCT